MIKMVKVEKINILQLKLLQWQQSKIVGFCLELHVAVTSNASISPVQHPKKKILILQVCHTLP